MPNHFASLPQSSPIITSRQLFDVTYFLRTAITATQSVPERDIQAQAVTNEARNLGGTRVGLLLSVAASANYQLRLPYCAVQETSMDVTRKPMTLLCHILSEQQIRLHTKPQCIQTPNLSSGSVFT